MKSALQPICLTGLLVFCGVAVSVPASPQTTDSVRIKDVAPSPQTPLTLTPDMRSRIVVTVEYVLRSAERASLTVFAEEYPEAAGGCRGGVHATDGGGQLAIQRGAGSAQVTVIWPANVTGNPMPVYPKGYVTVGANFFTSDGSHLIQSAGLFPQICYHFAPQGSVRPSPPSPPSPTRPPRNSPAPSIPNFYRWLPGSNGSVPPGAVVGGYSSVQYHSGSTAVSYGTPYYVCRAVYKGSTFPGKVVGKNCNFSSATGKEALAASYEVLTAQSSEYSLDWQKSGSPPAMALIGGNWGDNLYLCQLPYQGGLHPGWATPAHSGRYVCYIGWGGHDVVLEGFSYLVPIKGQRID